MKKRNGLAMLLTGAMLCGTLAGCGGDTSSDTASTASTGEDDGTLNMTLIMSLRDEFLSALETGAKNAASEVGVNLATQDAQNDTSKLIQYIESARNAGHSERKRCLRRLG